MSPYGYEAFDYLEPVAEMFTGFVAVLLIVIGLVALTVGIVSYVLSAAGLHAVAKRRGIHHSWLAWVPVGSAWLLGCVSDQYQFLTKRRNTKRRTLLLVLGIVQVAISPLSSLMELVSLSGMDSEVAVGALLGLSLLLGLAVAALSIVNLVFTYIALYDLYASCDPSGATLCLVFSILFSVTMPFFVFFNRKKDLGMPARKTVAQPTPEIVDDDVPFEPQFEADTTEPAADDAGCAFAEEQEPAHPQTDGADESEDPTQPE